MVIGFFLGYLQLRDSLARADVNLTFESPQAVAVRIQNTGSAVARSTKYGFGLFDISVRPPTPLPIPVSDVGYVRGRSESGPYRLLSQYGVKDHEYFGFAFNTYENCAHERYYWLHVVHGKPETAWVYEVPLRDAPVWSWQLLTQDPQTYMFRQIPPSRRVPIR
jgi:hypothetical protein